MFRLDRYVPFAVCGLLSACGSRSPDQPLPSPPAPTAAPAVAPDAQPSPEQEAPPRLAPLAESDEGALGSLPPDLGLALQSRAPDLTLTDAEGRPFSLGEQYQRGATMVIFYRGGWCPFCNTQIHALSEAHAAFAERGVTIVAISVDRPSEAARTRASWKIPFPVLSDPKLVAHEVFRVVHTADAAEVERLSGFGIDLERASGETHHRFAVPSAFLVDTSGIVRWVHADRDYKTRPSVPQLLAAVDSVLTPAATP